MMIPQQKHFSADPSLWFTVRRGVYGLGILAVLMLTVMDRSDSREGSRHESSEPSFSISYARVLADNELKMVATGKRVGEPTRSLLPVKEEQKVAVMEVRPSKAKAEATEAWAISSRLVAGFVPEHPIALPSALRLPASRPATSSGPFELRLTSTSPQQVWVRVSIDGGASQLVPLNKQGQTVTWTAKRGYVLNIDDAGGVRARLNGEDLPRLGPAGRARQNIVIPSAAFSVATVGEGYEQ